MVDPEYNLKKTLHILSINSRATTKEIAKEINTTQQNVSNRLTKLTENKYINSFRLFTDPSKFGFTNFCVLLRLKKYSKSILNKITNDLKTYKEITGIEILFGNFDIFLKFTTPNTSYFNKLLREILIKYPREIVNYKILTLIVLYAFPSNYLSQKRPSEKYLISGDREALEIDKTDKQILNLLNDNSRTNFSIIARKLNTTAKTIISRVRNLEKQNIIKGYTINLNHKKLNIKRYYLLFKIDFSDPNFDKEFITFVQNSPNIVEFIKIFGAWDKMLIIETMNEEEFKEILYIIKEKFSERIEDYIFLESEEVKLWKYLPELELD